MLLLATTMRNSQQLLVPSPLSPLERGIATWTRAAAAFAMALDWSLTLAFGEPTDRRRIPVRVRPR